MNEERDKAFEKWCPLHWNENSRDHGKRVWDHLWPWVDAYNGHDECQKLKAELQKANEDCLMVLRREAEKDVEIERLRKRLEWLTGTGGLDVIPSRE